MLRHDGKAWAWEPLTPSRCLAINSPLLVVQEIGARCGIALKISKNFRGVVPQEDQFPSLPFEPVDGAFLSTVRSQTSTPFAASC